MTAETGDEHAEETGQAVQIRDTATGRFLPGHTGNPHGRPTKGNTIAERLKALKPSTNASITASIVKEAQKGSAKHARIVLEYQTGTPPRADAGSQDPNSPFAILAQAMAGAITEARRAPAVEGEYREMET